jgi:hypothetical protein
MVLHWETTSFTIGQEKDLGAIFQPAKELVVKAARDNDCRYVGAR